MTNRLQWFTERIGKRVFRNNTTCPCGVCSENYEHGLVIHDRNHASYMNDLEGEYNIDGFPLKYFDTKEEALQWESENPWPEIKKPE